MSSFRFWESWFIDAAAYDLAALKLFRLRPHGVICSWNCINKYRQLLGCLYWYADVSFKDLRCL